MRSCRIIEESHHFLAESGDLVPCWLRTISVKANILNSLTKVASAATARVMEINIKLHLAELVRGMEERAAAQSESTANRRAISIRGLDLGARVDFSNAQRGEVAIVAPFGQVLRIQDRVRTVPKPKLAREHPIIRAHKWHQMLQSGEVATRFELAKRMKLTPGVITRILKLIELDPGIQAYLAELKTTSAILHFGYRPMGELADLQPHEQRAAFDKMRAAYEGVERRRNERGKTITLPSSTHSPSKTPRISAG